MKKIYSYLWNFFVSRKLAVYILAFLILMLMVGSFFPNPAYLSSKEINELKNNSPLLLWLGKHLNPSSLSESWFFVFFIFFILLNTFCCTVQRIFSDDPSRGNQILERTMNDKEHGKLERYLEQGRWDEFRTAEEEKRYESGRYGFWGSVLFHISLMGIIIGYLYSVFAGFSGIIKISEGQKVDLKRESFVTIYDEPVSGMNFPFSAVKLNRYEPRYEDKRHPVDYSADFSFLKKNGRVSNVGISINHPFKSDGYSFLLGEYGYSPLFVIRKEGNIVLNSFVSLRVVGNKSDHIDLPGEDKLKVSFYPDFFVGSKGPGTRSPVPDNPVFKVVLLDENKENSEAYLNKNEKINVGKYTVSFPELRYWLTVKIVRETGIFLIFLILCFGIAGLLLRFLWYKRTLYVKLTGEDEYLLRAYTPHFPVFFREELKEVFNDDSD